MGYLNFIRLFDLKLDDLTELTVTTLLFAVIIFIIIGLFRRWFVVGWVYDRQERELREARQRLQVMEMLAYRGTNIAEQLAKEKERVEDELDEDT
jgi:hypothetical protein